MLKRLCLVFVVMLGLAACAAADAPRWEKQFNGNGGPIVAVGWHPNGQQISFGTMEGALRVRDLSAADDDTNLLDAAGWLAYSPIVVAANPNGSPLGSASLLTLSPGGRFSIWYPDTFQRQSWSDGAGTLGALSADGRVMACTNGKEGIHVWPLNHYDPSWHSVKMPRPDLDGRVTALALNRNGALLASGYLLADGSGRFIVWDRLPGKILNAHPLDQAPGQIAYSPKGTHLAVVGRTKAGQGFISLWAPRGDGEPAVFAPPPSPVLSAEFSPDEKLLATGRIDGTIDIWDVASQKIVRTIPQAHQGPVRAVSWHPRGISLASGGEDGFVRLWSLK
jgi:WD40 repeat protein